MAETTKIDYADATWSPWIGCDKRKDPGCIHCYAEAWARRNKRFAGHWGPDAPRYFFGDDHWQKPLRWNRKAEQEGVRRRVLVSLCDPFEISERAADEQMLERRRLWHLIRKTPKLDWLVLTKRPENMQGWRLPEQTRALPWPSPNLWLGVSVSTQRDADTRIPLLLEVPAALHWVSMEPLLGPIELELGCDACQGTGGYLLHAPGCESDLCALNGDELSCDGGGIAQCCKHAAIPGIKWLVVGCESRGARPGRHCDLAWAHALREQCRGAGVPMFTKQLAGPGGRLLKSAQLKQLGWPVHLPEVRP